MGQIMKICQKDHASFLKIKPYLQPIGAGQSTQKPKGRPLVGQNIFNQNSLKQLEILY